MFKLLKNTTIYPFIIFLLTLIIYLRTLHYGFIWDDVNYIVNNPALGNSSRLLDLWISKNNIDYWPLSYSLFWLVKQLFGSDPFYFHLTNLILFIFSLGLIYIILNKLKFKYSWLVVLIYAVHPMNVSLVSWAFQAKTNLSIVLGLSSFYFFVSYYDNKKKFDYLISSVFFVLSLFAKINLIFYPILLLLYLVFKKELSIKWLIKTGPFFVSAFIFGIINVLWYKDGTPTPESEIVLKEGFFFRLQVVVDNFIFYLRQIFVPNKLMFVHAKIDPTAYATILNISFLIIIFLGLLFLQKRKQINCFTFGLIGFGLILLPVLGFFEVYYMRFSYVAEHYLNIAMIAILIPFISYISLWKFKNFVFFIYTLSMFVLSYNYVQAYKDEKTVLEASIKAAPNAMLPHSLLGLIYKNEGNFERAIYHYDKANEAHPDAACYYNKAVVLEKLNRLDEAEQNYKKSIELNPYSSNAYINLGVLNLKNKNPAEAQKLFEQALSVDMNNPLIMYNLGYLLEESKNLDKAKLWYEKALGVNAQFAPAAEALGRIKNAQKF